MTYAQTKTYTLDAASTSMADIMAALIAHWTAAPGLWQIKTGVAAVASEAVVIQAKSDPTCDIAIRRVGTTELGVTLDPNAEIASSGGASTAPTGSGDASPECQHGTMSGISTRFFVVECVDAIFITFQDSAKSNTPYGIHAGKIYMPARATDEALGADGHGVLVGAISVSGSPSWSSSSVQSNGSRVRVFDSSGAAHWAQTQFDMLASSSGSFASASEDGQIKSPRPIPIFGININSSNDMMLGLTKYLAGAPYSSSPSFGNAAPRNTISSSTDEAWIYLRNSASTTGLIGSWERGVSPT